MCLAGPYVAQLDFRGILTAESGTVHRQLRTILRSFVVEHPIFVVVQCSLLYGMLM